MPARVCLLQIPPDSSSGGGPGAAALPCQTSGSIPRGLCYAGLCWEGSSPSPSLFLSREKGSSGRQSQACSTLCLAGKEVIYKLTQLLESHSTGEGAGSISVRERNSRWSRRGTPGAGERTAAPSETEGTKEPFVPGCLSSLPVAGAYK